MTYQHLDIQQGQYRRQILVLDKECALLLVRLEEQNLGRDALKKIELNYLNRRVHLALQEM